MLTLSNLTQVCSALNNAGVKYILVGGFAIFLHGYERTTRDIDLLIDPAIENVQKIKVALAKMLPEACAELKGQDVGENIVVRMVGKELVVDLMKKIGDIDYFNAKSIAEKVEGILIPLADLDTLIELKKGVRDRDQKDLLFLEGKREFLRKQKK